MTARATQKKNDAKLSQIVFLLWAAAEDARKSKLNIRQSFLCREKIPRMLV
ncbi:hypothetical protein [Burkholderia humptydooensis]|uniref:hypothetical protein n=1 Tax=Burkholderia humptydooensis TaxID=430531 RepID=UPI0012FE6978|nr:hypothetical protein [Burkholderia humptydooensis]